SSLLLANPCVAQGRTSVETGAAAARPLALAERQAAWNANKAEYRRRIANDGQRSADRWLDQQALAMRNGKTGSTANGSSPNASRADAPGAAKSKSDCKKIRWVNRATPGFGGGGMTMSRVPVCAD